MCVRILQEVLFFGKKSSRDGRMDLQRYERLFLGWVLLCLLVVLIHLHGSYFFLRCWVTASQDPILRRPHQSTDWELCLEPLSSATWKALVPTKGGLKSPAVNRGGLTLCWPVDAAPKNAAKSTQRLVQHWAATLTEIFRAFSQL
jgi:hypothetical protein